MKSLLLLLLIATPVCADIYTWKQGGATHYTNQPDTIPLRYRSKARILALPGEVKSPQWTPSQGQGAPSLSTLPLPPPPPAAVAPQAPVKRGATVKNERRGRRSVEED